jgi:signal transduction histidine kinase
MAVEALPNLLRSASRIGSGRGAAGRVLRAGAVQSWKDFVPSALVLACGIAITAGGFMAARNQLDSLERRGFEVEAAGHAAVLRDGMRQYAEVLNSMAAFVSASRGVDRWEFLRFTEQTLPRYPGFAALEWVPRVAAGQRAKYERRAQVDGLFGLRIREFGPDDELVPASERPEYYPVYYVEPFEGHERLLGFDLAADGAARAVLTRAEEYGRILAARLPPDSAVAGRDAELWFVLPLFDGEALQKPAQERHDALLGFAIGAISVKRMVDAAIEAAGLAAPMAVRVVDENPGALPAVLFALNWDDRAAEEGGRAAALRHSTSFDIAGGAWRIELMRLADASPRPQDALPWGVALISLLLTGLLLQHMTSTVLRRRAIERAVQERTAELAAANRELQVEIAERRRAEINLRSAKEQAEVANRAKSEFLAMVSHELKTPLNAIIGFSDILANQTLGPIGKTQYLDYASDIRDSGHYLLKIINDILDLSRIESGNLTLIEEQVELVSVVQSAVRLIKPRAEAAGLTIETQFPSGILIVVADARAMKQILVNLLSNAVKFTPKAGRVTVSVGLEAGRPTIAVADTGIGIPAKDLGRVCEPFVQVDTSLARRFEGTGLGLTLTKRLVDLHGGELVLRSTVGSGTTVTVRLPAERRVDRQVRDEVA